MRTSPGSGLRGRLASSAPVVMARRWTERLVAAGTAGYTPEVRRRLRILNVMAYLIAFFTAVYAVEHALTDMADVAPVVYINLALVFCALSVPLLHRVSEIAGGLMIAVSEFVALFLLASLLGRSSGVALQLVIGAAAPFVIFGLGRLKLVYGIVATAFVLYVTAWFRFPHTSSLVSVSQATLDGIYVTAAVTTFGLIAAIVYYAFRLAESAQAETDGLLRNILPEPIVERLKANPGATIADSFEDASVLFADLKGFVPIARSLGPARTVEFLNGLVREFDALAARHGVEKIKTIGDAYMVAAGVPEPASDHAARLARLGLDMVMVVARLAGEVGYPLAMRVGIASGPVMAGVIGAKRLTYDVWGDTVNLASRLESQGEPGRVLVSAATRIHLERGFDLVPRGAIEVKGMGVQEAWIVIGEKLNSAALARHSGHDFGEH